MISNLNSKLHNILNIAFPQNLLSTKKPDDHSLASSLYATPG